MKGKKKPVTSSSTNNKTNKSDQINLNSKKPISNVTVPTTPLGTIPNNINNNINNLNLDQIQKEYTDFEKTLDKEFLKLNLDQLKSSQQTLKENTNSINNNNNNGNTNPKINKTNKSNNSSKSNSNIITNNNVYNILNCFQDVPPLALYSFRLGNNEYYKERYTLAIEYYNTALMETSSNYPLFLVVILINRSISKLRIQEYKKSILDSTLAISIQPNCIKAYVCRCFGYFFTRDFKKAFSDHFIAMNLCPKNITLQHIMKYSFGATFLYNQTNIQELISKTKSNTTILPQNSKNLLWISDFNSLSIEEEQSRINLAINYHKQMNHNNLNGNSSSNQNILQQQKQQQKLSSSNQKPVSSNNSPPSLIPFGEYSYGTSWSDLEEYHSNKKTSVAETMSSKQKILGNSDFQDRNYIAALGHYTKAIKLYPDDHIYYSNRGIVYYKLNRFYEAITDCTVSIEKQNQQIKAYLRRGSSYLAIGDYTSAVDDFRSGLKYEPDSIDLLECLCRALNYIEQDIKFQMQLDPNSESLRDSLKSLVNEISALNNKLSSNKLINDQSNNKSANNTNQNTSNNNKQKATIVEDNSKQNNTNNNNTNNNNTSKISKVKVSQYIPETKEQLERYESLIVFLNSLIDQKVGNLSITFLARAEAYLQIGDIKNSLADYQTAISINPNDNDIKSRYQSLQLKLESINEKN